MTRRLAPLAAAAALLLLPAGASAADTVSVTAGVLTYTSGDGTADVVWVTDWSATQRRVTDFRTPAFTFGSGCVAYGSLSADCTGATSATLALLDGDDTARVKSNLPATVAGGDGDDTLEGGPAADTLRGGEGADTIDALDGVADTVDCGPGVDTLQADPIDVVTGCDDAAAPAPAPVEPAGEPVVATEPPPASEPPPAAEPAPVAGPGLPLDVATPPADALATAVAVPREIGVSPGGVASFDVRCPADEAAGCAGRVFVDPAPRARGRADRRARAARRGRYGRARFAVPAGGRTKLAVRLSASARAALGLPRGRRALAARRGRPVKAVVTVSQQGKKPAKTKVRLKP